jgi:autotransporter-associated beta strand protein
VTLSQANTVSGATTINGGTLNLNLNTGLGSSAVSIGSSGTVNVTLSANGNIANVFTGAGTLTVSGSTGTPTFTSASGLNGFTGTLNVNTTGSQKVSVNTAGEKIGSGATVNITSGGTLYIATTTASFDGVNFNVVGSGNTENLGAIRIEGNSVIGATSSVVLGGDTSLGSNTGTGTINAPITQTTASAVTKVGAGILALGGANTYTGATTVSAGTLSITGNSTGLTGGFVVNKGATLTLNGNTGSIVSNPAIQLNGGIFNYQNTTVGSTFDASGYSFSGGDRTYQSTYGTSGNAVLNLASATRTAGTTNNYTTSGGTNGTTNKITFTSAPSTGVLVDKGDYFGGTSYLAYDSTGYARAYNYSTDANGATSTGGTTLGGSVTGKNVDLTTAAVTAQTTDSINTLRLGTTNGVAISTGNTLSVDGILKSGGNAATISGGSIKTATSAGEMVIRTNASGDSLTISSVIADNGTSSLTKSGLGTLVLSGANTYAGGTTISAGTLQLNSGGTLGTGGTVTVNNSASLLFNQGSTANTAFANNFVFNTGSTVGYTTDGRYTLGSGTAGTASNSNTIAVNGATTLEGKWDNKPLFLGGVVSGTGAITLQNAGAGSNNVWGVNFLNGTNTYSGTITTAGAYSSGTGAGILVGNSTALQFASVINNTTGGSTNDNGVVFNVTSATLGSLAGTGNSILTQNTAASGSTPNVSGGAVALTVGGNNNSTSYSGILSGGGSLTKTGTGTMTLSGANTFTGATTISGGKLNVTGSISSSTGGVAVSGGTTTALGGSGSIAGAVTVTNGSRLAPGLVTSSSNFGSAGTLTLSNASGLTLTDANLDFDLSTTATGSNDKIALGSNALSFSTLNFSFSGTTLDTSTAYTLISTTGSLSAGSLGSITTDFTNVTGGGYTASYNFVAGTGLQVSFAAVPEPHEFALAIVGLLCVLVVIRRRNQEI